jgi:DNA-binding IclR family transcriptional regulator
LAIRTGDTVRFIASVESRQALRISSRGGMVFPAHHTMAGLLLLTELAESELDGIYAGEHYQNRKEVRRKVRRRPAAWRLTLYLG